MRDALSSPGRPPFRIDGQRLRELRKSERLSQIALGRRVYARLGKAATSDEVVKTSYQRWERLGATTPETAEALAVELRTTVAVLQGGAPEAAPSGVDLIEARLREMSEQGSAGVSDTLAKYAADGNPFRQMAVDIGSRLEAAQLSQAQDELADLAALTGLTLEELQRPMSIHGYWLLIGNGPMGRPRSEILHGVTDVLNEVREELARCLDLHESDARVSFHDDKPWLRVEIRHPRIAQLTRTLRFVRCQPGGTGLQWIQPTWWDRFWLNQLPEKAFDHANFVSGFDGNALGPTDVCCLRLAITKNPSYSQVQRLGGEVRPEIVAVVALGSGDPPSWVRSQFEVEGTLHDVATTWLTSALWDHLQPFITDWPVQFWRFAARAGRVDLMLEAPAYLLVQRGGEAHFGSMCSIVLAEQSADGKLRSVPWRRASVAAAQKRLESLLEFVREQVSVGPPRPLRL